MSHLPAFNGFEDFFLKKSDLFKPLYDSSTAHTDPLPEKWNDELNSF